MRTNMRGNRAYARAYVTYHPIEGVWRVRFVRPIFETAIGEYTEDRMDRETAIARARADAVGVVVLSS